MTQVGTSGTMAEGNTNSSARCRRWCLTLNNYDIEDVKRIDTLTHKFTKWIVGQEVGENKTPHLQMYVECKNAKRFATMKKMFPKSHIEKAKGSLKDNYKYCSKDGIFKSNIDLRTFEEKINNSILEEEYTDVKWKDWQQEVLDILDGNTDKRKIYWYWESKGNVGKSYLCKYIALKHKGIIICEVKKADIFNQVRIMMDLKIEPKIILLDVPRTAQDYINYGVIEQLKNGLIYSGKYEGGKCIFRHPKIICFSNREPEKENMSLDRWAIREI